MDPDKENTENKYDIKTTVNALHDSGIDIMEDSPRPQENEFSTGAAPKLGPASQARVGAVPPPPIPKAPAPIPPMQPGLSDRPSAQSIIDGVLGMGNVKAPDTSSRNDPSIKPLRTFKSDAEEAVKYNNVSKITIAVAEQERREATPTTATSAATAAANGIPGSTPIEYTEGNSSSKVFIMLLILGILLGAGTGAYYWFFVRQVVPPAIAKIPKGLTVKTPISYDKADTVQMEKGKDPLALIAGKLSSLDVPIGQTYALLPLEAGTTTVLATPSSLFSSTHIPSRLSRSIAGEYMVGTYFSNSNNPFFIIKNTFFQNAFAGMLDWEKDMRNDLIQILRVANPEEIAIETGSGIFTDMVVSNIDSRILKNSAGKIILAYGFTDKDTLVIATNPETLKHVMDQLLAVRVVQ